MKRMLVTLVIAMGLVACGGGKPVAYRPVAFGENGHCYYVHDPAEVVELKRTGLCSPDWVPTVMPSTYHQRYYPYYSSPAYYGTYVPVGMRTVYVERARTFGEANKSAIVQEAKQATYQGSNGKTVTADKIGATKYGGGNRFGKPGAKFGGGARDATPAKAEPTPAVKSSPAPAPQKSPAAPKASNPKPSTGSKPASGGSGGYKPSGGSKSFGGGGGRPSGGGGKR